MGPWSPDGTTIAFESTRTGGPQIYLMNADGTNQRVLVGPRKGKDEDAAAPAWSPDGRFIAFDRGLGSTFEIWLIKPDGTGEKRLTNNSFADISPSWAPDGRTISFLSTRSL
jgi:TolB protein